MNVPPTHVNMHEGVTTLSTTTPVTVCQDGKEETATKVHCELFFTGIWKILLSNRK